MHSSPNLVIVIFFLWPIVLCCSFSNVLGKGTVIANTTYTNFVAGMDPYSHMKQCTWWVIG